MAMLPTAEAPVRNLAALIHLIKEKEIPTVSITREIPKIITHQTYPSPSLLIRKWVDPPPKNKQGIGTSTYISATILF